MSEGEWCRSIPAGIRLAVQVMPNARKTEVLGVFDGALKIRLQAPPIEGKGNEALVRYIAQTLKVPRSSVVITHGLSSKRKLLEIHRPALQVAGVMATLLPAA